jgi:hypothetical protein
MSNSSCGSGGGKCGVAKGEPSAAFAIALSVGWGLLPIPFAAAARRRARKRKPRANQTPAQQDANPEVQP